MPVQKKRKVDHASLFNKETLEKVKVYAGEHEKGKPYAHTAVQNLLCGDSLRKIVKEAKDNLNTNFKETDLFKMYQTLDLANFVECEDEELMEMRAKVPTIVKLRDALYSKEFREFVREVCGTSMELTERVDMAMQAYSKGGHLLCHDDVIGTRAVSFIIYLTDPDEAWTPEMGGSLELYDTKDGLPENLPTSRVLPTSNTMVVFRVTPGVTFHSVAETLQDDTPRLSLQGWFHSAKPPPNAEETSSLAMLKDLKKEPTVFGPLKEPIPEGGLDSLTKKDIAFLEKYVNEEYMKPESWEKIRKKFAEDGSVQLMSFLKKELAVEVLGECMALDEKDGVGSDKFMKEYDAGVKEGVVLVGSPVTQRYLKYEGGKTKIEEVRNNVMKSAAFTRLVAVLTGLRPLGEVGEVRRFRAGADYTVAYHKLLEPDTRLDATLCFVAPCDGWVTGDIGGFECYIAADTSDLVAAETYGNEEDSGNDLLSINATNNTLSLVARDEQMMRFVKYISASAPGSRWDVVSTYEIECDAESEEDEEMEDEEAEEEQ
eukprot:TRINITY_DN8038_c3_g1_i1.p1 TRINITY_DN8038_c3_g1~~TRINITY_DN8038_c3_g1_i1.p1  ORF type:complete len:543 (+),score=191.14 TRINITY_DN8038_c3_g1_i1:47-1675(+)